MPHGSLPASVAAEVGRSPRSWRRWPCPACGHRERRTTVVCPACQALPWHGADGDGDRAIPRVVRAGRPLEVRSKGPFHARHRFKTPEGFLGVLSRRLTGGAHWLGGDGGEWFLRRYGVLGKTWALHDGRHALAAAESVDPWRTAYRIWEGERAYRLHRSGIARHNFSLAVEDGPEAARIHGGLLDPLRRVEVTEDLGLAVLALACTLAGGMRRGEGEG